MSTPLNSDAIKLSIILPAYDEEQGILFCLDKDVPIKTEQVSE